MNLARKVLTCFLSRPGATFIPDALNAVFGSLKSLDEPWFSLGVHERSIQLCKVFLARFLQEKLLPQLCKAILARFLQGTFFVL